jgi:hypothetical protein
LLWALKTNAWWNSPDAANNTGNLILKTAFYWHDMTRLTAYRWTDMDIGCYQRLYEVQMTSTIVEYLQGIPIGKEAAIQCKTDQEIQQ